MEGPESSRRVACMSRKSRLEKRMKHLHRDPSWRCRDQDFPHSGLSQGSAERQREEGLRAFDLLVAGVKPPDLGGTTFTVGPVLVLVVVQLVVVLSCVLFLCKQAN